MFANDQFISERKIMTSLADIVALPSFCAISICAFLLIKHQYSRLKNKSELSEVLLLMSLLKKHFDDSSIGQSCRELYQKSEYRMLDIVKNENSYKFKLTISLVLVVLLVIVMPVLLSALSVLIWWIGQGIPGN
jgi:hypothetical protein